MNFIVKQTLNSFLAWMAFRSISWTRQALPKGDILVFMLFAGLAFFGSRIFNLMVQTQVGLEWYLLLEQDLLGYFIFLAISQLLVVVLPLGPGMRSLLRSMWLLLLFVILIVSRKYYSLYLSEFAWFHLGQDGGANSLWFSIRAEFSNLILALFVLALCVTGFYGYLNLRQLRKLKFPIQADRLLQLYHDFWILILLMVFIALLIHPHYKEMHPEVVDEGNIIVRLLRTKKQQVHKIESASSANAPNSTEFRYHFDSKSLLSQTQLARIPFSANGTRLNIVFYFFESTAFRYLGHKDPEGKSITPTWDYLYKNSLAFHNHYANNPLSINALFNVLCSAYPLPSDRWAARDYPDIALPCLPEVLQKQGYRTAAYHSGYLAYAGAGRFLENRGFDEIKDVSELVKEGYPMLNWGVDDRALLDVGLRFIKQQEQKPYFVVYLPVSPHHPYETPNLQYPLGIPEALRDGRTAAFRQYLNSLHYSDQVLAELLQGFKKAGQLENTLFFIFADHGEAFGQHRRNYNHPFFLYEENVHVPFLIFNPRWIPKGQKVNRISRHIDIMPTALNMLDIPAPIHMEGRSLLRHGSGSYAPVHTTWRNRLVGLRDQNYKYLYDQIKNKSQLFDLNTDPLEKKNIAPANLKLVQKFQSELARLEKHQRQFFETVLNKKINWDATQDKTNF